MLNIEIDRTEQEREELLKAGIKRYWKLAAAGFLAIVVIVYATHSYRRSHLQSLSEAAARTQIVKHALSVNRLEEAEKATALLQKENKDESFALLATLSLAKYYFDKQDYEKAAQQYQWIIKNSSDAVTRDLARLRQARVFADNQKAKDAISLLNGLESTTESLEATLLKADILLQDKQFDTAESAYNTLKDKGINPTILDERLNLLALRKAQATQ